MGGVLRLSPDAKAAGYVALSFMTTVDPKELDRSVAQPNWCPVRTCWAPSAASTARKAREPSQPPTPAGRTLARGEASEAAGRSKRIPPHFGGQRATCNRFESGQVTDAESPRAHRVGGHAPTLLSKLMAGYGASVDTSDIAGIGN